MSTNDCHAAQIVLLAIELEQRCGLLYQDWARRFLPYDRGISKLLEELAREEHTHASEFHALQETITDDELPTNTTLAPEFAACTEKLKTIQDHFFVTSPVMATTIICNP